MSSTAQQTPRGIAGAPASESPLRRAGCNGVYRRGSVLLAGLAVLEVDLHLHSSTALGGISSAGMREKQRTDVDPHQIRGHVHHLRRERESARERESVCERERE